MVDKRGILRKTRVHYSMTERVCHRRRRPRLVPSLATIPEDIVDTMFHQGTIGVPNLAEAPSRELD